MDFFIVGEPKSGTTALTDFLSQHPDIYMPEGLEPHFFCTDLHKEEDRRKKSVDGERFFKIREFNDYQRLFGNGGKDQIWGEKSVHYLLSKAAAGKIYKYNPKAKIIVLLREPMSFLSSLYSHYLMMKMETAESLAEALGFEGERRRERRVPERAPIASLLFYLENVRYSDHLKRFYKFFDKGSVKIIFYEDFKKDNKGVYREVLCFLGVDESFVPKFRRVNVRRRFRIDFLFWLTNDSVVYRRVMDMVPLRIRRWLAPWCDWIFFERVKNDDSKISRGMKRELDKIIETEIVELTKLLGVDVRDKWDR